MTDIAKATGCNGISPQPPTWAGLTHEEVAILEMEFWGCASIAPRNAPNFARAIEAKLREKNGEQS